MDKESRRLASHVLVFSTAPECPGCLPWRSAASAAGHPDRQCSFPSSQSRSASNPARLLEQPARRSLEQKQLMTPSYGCAVQRESAPGRQVNLQFYTGSTRRSRNFALAEIHTAGRGHKQSLNLQVPFICYPKKRDDTSAAVISCEPLYVWGRKSEWWLEGKQYLLVVLAVWPIKSNDGIRRDGDRCWWRKWTVAMQHWDKKKMWFKCRESLKAIRQKDAFGGKKINKKKLARFHLVCCVLLRNVYINSTRHVNSLLAFNGKCKLTFSLDSFVTCCFLFVFFLLIFNLSLQANRKFVLN